ncbi:ubiquitin carboxyl-terminal hydrolase 7 isoform X1 [Brachionus plicatilis]|uniref:Ubiquitin carboxyl-terminal hydrolase 7 isoform X1 n=1 Tax=Brachionus plicatilis TaxID=10195 RepID=A0A3M7T7X6_BRAPC|nr:ubiquitin carboxyl-terminal hydrolase 7 isoform X1 [Brachionus plicatilis]
MDEIQISLPCGFSANYRAILISNGRFPCPVCKKHNITKQECLKMTRNKMLINEFNFNLKKKKYEELMQEFENYKNDPEYYIDESFDSLKREVDLRREEIKVMLNKEIDDYHDGLLEKIDMERDLKLKELKERIQQTQTLDLVKFDADRNSDVYSKIDFFEKNNLKIDNGINLVENIINDLNEPKFELTNSCNDIDLTKLFGELYTKEETCIILNKDEIDDESRTEATIQLTLNDFSLLKNKNNCELYSKDFIVHDYEWNILIRLNADDGWMEFFLVCDSIKNSIEFSVNATAEFTLLNKSDSKKDFSRKYEHLFTQKEPDWGFFKFTTMNEIMNPTKGYYDSNKDSITVKVLLKAETPQKI